MGQGEIMRALEQYPDRWFTSLQLSVVLQNSQDTINRIMRKMRQYNEVEWRSTMRGKRHIYQYRWKQ